MPLFAHLAGALATQYPTQLGSEKLQTLLLHPASQEKLVSHSDTEALLSTWEKEAAAFSSRRSPHLIYR